MTCICLRCVHLFVQLLRLCSCPAVEVVLVRLCLEELESFAGPLGSTFIHSCDYSSYAVIFNDRILPVVSVQDWFEFVMVFLFV